MNPVNPITEPGQQSGQDVAPKGGVVQLPFRCSPDFLTRLIKAKGAYMVKTGEQVSNNSFFLKLMAMGLDRLEQ